MKKFIIIILLLNIATAANSQVIISGKIGVNYARLDAESFEQHSITGYQAGLALNFEMNKNFSFQPEILLSLKGGELKDKNLNGSDYFDDLKTRKTYIDLPLLLKFKPTNDHKADFYLIAGIQPGYCLWTNQTSRTLDMQSNINGPDSKLAFGLIGGAGIDLFNFSALEFRYEYGLSDVLGFPGEKYANRVFTASFSYRLSKNSK